jgi:tetratricopeptide (TPR) repeat protein
LAKSEEALKFFKKSAEIAPSSVWAHFGLAVTYAYMGRNHDAQTAALKVLSIDPNFSISDWEKANPSRDRESIERLCEAARKAGIPD